MHPLARSFHHSSKFRASSVCCLESPRLNFPQVCGIRMIRARLRIVCIRRPHNKSMRTCNHLHGCSTMRARVAPSSCRGYRCMAFSYPARLAHLINSSTTAGFDIAIDSASGYHVVVQWSGTRRPIVGPYSSVGGTFDSTLDCPSAQGPGVAASAAFSNAITKRLSNFCLVQPVRLASTATPC